MEKNPVSTTAKKGKQSISLISCKKSHLSSSLIVVQVHLGASVALDLSNVEKFTGEFDPKVDVDWTATPFPSLLVKIETENFDC